MKAAKNVLEWMREYYKVNGTPSYGEIIAQLELSIDNEKAMLNTGGICKITNNKFSWVLEWVLEVDKQTITFNGSDNADYFAELYTKLGYTIEWDRDKLQRD